MRRIRIAPLAIPARAVRRAVAAAALPAAVLLVWLAPILSTLPILPILPSPARADAAPPALAGADSLPPPPSRTSPRAGPSIAIVAYDSTATSWGAACAAAEVACGARIAGAAVNAGAVALLGPGASPIREALAALSRGAAPESALAILRSASEDGNARQAIAVARDGRAAAVSGSRMPGVSAIRMGRGFACAGFGLRDEGSLGAMAEAFAKSTGALGARLIGSLEAAERVEGEPFMGRGEDASAALVVVRDGGDSRISDVPLVDLRVDASDDPVRALSRIYTRYAETFLPAAHVRFGDEARRRGDDAAAAREYREAETGFRAAVSRAPKSGDALNELAWFLATRGGDSSEALRFAEAAVAARGDDPNFLDTLAEAAYRAGNLERAIEAAERAVRFARGNARYAERLRALRAARAALVSPSR
jgi:uncharacterized Ntn-hydrolase superfamily protein